MRAVVTVNTHLAFSGLRPPLLDGFPSPWRTRRGPSDLPFWAPVPSPGLELPQPEVALSMGQELWAVTR